MRIRVLLFGQLKDIVGRPEESLEVQPGTKLSDLMARYAEHFPKFGPMAGSIACSLNREYASASSVLHDGDEVGFLPPVSGGSTGLSVEVQEELHSKHCAIVREKIDSQKIADQLKAAADGAVAIFEGIVRNSSRGRPTLYLHYQAYDSMAINELERLAHGALEKFKIRDVRLVHRLGRLEIGETSVLVAVFSAHRGPAFDACRWLIDTLKKTVPIWKKEFFADGAVWADGEPFPEEIRAKTNE
ncbi:MAG TPA: molybdenum cofactor biosynthesis protein MoaE [Candidatus Angelobacter sp.]